MKFRVSSFKFRVGAGDIPHSTFHIPRSDGGFTPTRRFMWGFTLTEVMVTVGIIAIIAAFVLPGYQKTTEIRYWQASQDILQTIYAGEQVYKSAHDKYVDPSVASTDCATAWKCIYMDDPNGNAILPVAFTVTSTAWATSFTATATRSGGGCKNEVQTLNQDRQAGGAADTWKKTGVCP